MCMERRRFSQTMASEWQTASVVSHKMPRCALLTAVKNYNKSLEKLQDKDQDQMFKTKTKTSWSKTKTKTFIFVLEAPRNQDPGLENYITGNINTSGLAVHDFELTGKSCCVNYSSVYATISALFKHILFDTKCNSNVSDHFLQNAVSLKCTLMICNPAFSELIWADTIKNVTDLRWSRQSERRTQSVIQLEKWSACILHDQCLLPLDNDRHNHWRIWCVLFHCWIFMSSSNCHNHKRPSCFIFYFDFKRTLNLTEILRFQRL